MNQEPAEEVPEGEIFTIQVAFSRLEMQQPSFEQLVDVRLRALKEQIMKKARDVAPPPDWFPEDQSSSQ